MRSSIGPLFGILCFLALSAGFFGTGCGGGDGTSARTSQYRYASFETDVMATRLRVTLPVGPEDDATEAAETVFRIFRETDTRMSEWKESSPLAAVNRAAGGEPVPVPDDLRQILHRSVELARLTEGAFDPTWAALLSLIHI